MKRRALRKEFYMEIRRSMGRFLSIFFIVAIGVAFFSGIRAAEPDMRLSGDAYFDKKNLMDIQVISTLGLTEDDIAALEALEGVEAAEAGYSSDVLCVNKDSGQVLHVMSILPEMNKLTVESGRLPREKDECAVDADFLETSSYEIGDTLTVSSGSDADIRDTLCGNTFTIVGAVSSPCYISFHRGSAAIGNGSIAAFVSVLPESFVLDVYTELCVSVDGAKELTAFTDGYTARVEEVLAQIEAIQEERETARYESIVDEAEADISKARAKLDDERAKAREKLDEAQEQIEDGEVLLADGKEQISVSRAQISGSRSELISGQQQLDQKKAEADAQETVLNQNAAQLEVLKAQYEALLSSGQAQETVLQAMEGQIAQGEAQLAAGRNQLAAGRNQLAAAQTEIDLGWEELYRGEEELESAENDLAVKEQELADARKEYEDAKKEAEEEFADGEEKIQEAEEEIAEIEPAVWYLRTRDDLSEYSGYGENADRMRAIGQVFPVLFFLVAALISLTTMTRMVEEQRTQIGTLKALGYSRGAIAGKYLGYACLATVLGSVFGVLAGEKIFPFVIITAYGIMYDHIHTVVIPYQMSYAVWASCAAFVCTLTATVFSCGRELREQAAQLMRPPAPKKGKRVLLEKIPFLWGKLNFIWKSTVRNLLRYKKRFFMTIFGIGGCMALLLVGFGLQDSISNIGRLQYEELQLYDGNLILDTDASREEQEAACERLAKDSRVKDTEKNFLKQVTIGSGRVKRDVYLNVPEEAEKFPEFVVHKNRVTQEQYFLQDEGAILTEKMAKTLGVSVGDSIYIEDSEKGRIETAVTAVCENYLQHYLYMTPILYEKLYGEKPEYNAVYFLMKDDIQAEPQEVGEEVLTEKGALSVSYTADIAEQIDNMLGALNIVIVVLVVSAGMLAFVVLYNLNNINITERKRELATLKVLGFYPREVSAYVYRENGILTVLGAVLGIVLGRILHQFVIVTVEIDTAMFGRNIDPSSIIYSFLITVAFSLFVNIVMHFKLKNIDMVESLKSVE